MTSKRLAEIRERIKTSTPPRGEADFLQASAVLIDLVDLLTAYEAMETDRNAIGAAHDLATERMIKARNERDALTAQVAALHEALGGIRQEEVAPFITKLRGLGNARKVLADTAAAAEAFKRQVIDQWLNDNVPERYHYTSGPDGTSETAFGLLCKDALEAMPGNKRQQQLIGVRRAITLAYNKHTRCGFSSTSYQCICNKEWHEGSYVQHVIDAVLADMEREASA